MSYEHILIFGKVNPTHGIIDKNESKTDKKTDKKIENRRDL